MTSRRVIKNVSVAGVKSFPLEHGKPRSVHSLGRVDEAKNLSA